MKGTNADRRRGLTDLILTIGAVGVVLVAVAVVWLRSSDSHPAAVVSPPPVGRSQDALAAVGIDAVLSYVDATGVVSVDPVSGNSLHPGAPFGCESCPSVRVGSTAYASDGDTIHALDAESLLPRVFVEGRAVFPGVDGESLFVVTKDDVVEQRSLTGELIGEPHALSPPMRLPQVPRAVVDGVLVELGLNGPSDSAIWNPATGETRSITMAWQVIDTYTAPGATSSTIAWLGNECGSGKGIGCSLNFTDSATLQTVGVGVPDGFAQYFGGGGFSPDGRELAVFLSRTNAAVAPAAELAIVDVTHPTATAGVSATPPAVVSGSEVVLGEPRGFAVWTPDGRWVVFGGASGTLLAHREGTADAVQLDVPAFHSLAALPLPTGYVRPEPGTDLPNAVDPIAWIGEAHGPTIVVDSATPDGFNVSAMRQGDRICLTVDLAGRDDGPADCSTPASGPWPNGRMSAVLVTNGRTFVVGVAQEVVDSVDVTAGGVTAAADTGQTDAFPGLRFFAVPVAAGPARVVGHTASGDVTVEVS
jgi:hypothetical protein